MSTYMMATYEQWLDVKPNAQPMETSSYITEPHRFSEVQVVKLQNSELATELEKLCDVSELTQLTPPQTPPQTQSYINEILDFITQQSNSNVTDNAVIEEIIQATSPASSYVDYSSDTTNSPASCPDDQDIYVAQGSEIVDEILRTKAQDLPDCNDDNSMYSNYSSSGMSQSTNDSEWTPSPSPGSPSKSSGTKSSSTPSVINGGVTKKRVRPYSRNVEDKKSRKKEQNKNAATRYRQKKKQEMEEVLEEERQLTMQNEDLVRTATEIEREVKYLKKLIKEFFKAKYC
ncbi:activating transcription factor of chaperone isoform X2 [Hermetia illucens]|uniref:activating transcription factor of chaperone isoform X2 n=1 Tax=Hermetia illucens TaxID=343691 RepID=UPI0018CBFC25|nr:activating transcription factor of chaperone isoform X2 [Hermetia illucens]